MYRRLVGAGEMDAQAGKQAGQGLTRPCTVCQRLGALLLVLQDGCDRGRATSQDVVVDVPLRATAGTRSCANVPLLSHRRGEVSGEGGCRGWE